jgi:hypothetical protein
MKEDWDRCYPPELKELNDDFAGWQVPGQALWAQRGDEQGYFWI